MKHQSEVNHFIFWFGLNALRLFAPQNDASNERVLLLIGNHCGINGTGSITYFQCMVFFSFITTAVYIRTTAEDPKSIMHAMPLVLGSFALSYLYSIESERKISDFSVSFIKMKSKPPQFNMH